MLFWKRLSNRWRSGGDECEPPGPSSLLHLIDAASVKAGGGRERLSPRDQFAVLQQVAAFVQREKIKAVVLFEGRPLREVPDGGTYKSLTVRYAEDSAALCALALKLADPSALVITNDKALEEQAVAAGLETLRGSTLRKAMDDGGGRSDTSKRGGGRGGRRSRRSRRSTDGKPDRREKRDTPPPKKSGGDDSVSDLIDLV